MDGYISQHGRPVLISEVKNEMARSNSEPTLQASLYYMEEVKALTFNMGDNPIEISYEKQRDDGQLIFNGKTAEDDLILIKFTRKYGKEAHELCAENGLAALAPRLLAVEKDENWVRLLNS
ncbi:hypothetical protein Clacol_005185 [Clathrus columnatus]|uniref:Uncharacterized protein n=1 Tax=Clathrus columnatus TaxID=1419009 RepID=A0AAV5AEL8_9AGAM|nr:hypothetical protein Clacol_005185 [Clathrus columnatus]